MELSSELKTEIYNQIKRMEVIQYASSSCDIWCAILHTDSRLNDNMTKEVVWDMFTDIATDPEVYKFDHLG